MPTPWSETEVALTVADYFSMLADELCNESYNKTAHRNALLPLLNNRSASALEWKHQNISAVLIELKRPYIAGYKPRYNYQRLLAEAVENHLRQIPDLDTLIAADVERTPEVPTPEDILKALVARPVPAAKTASDYTERYQARPARKVDYLAREAHNSALGSAGEQFVVNFERARLLSVGQDSLADKVERVSETRGDGIGFDVLSFNENGTERFVEVKTTRYGKETPFYVTRNEVRVSEKEAARYQLCRVFEFERRPRLFQLDGALDQNCRLEPASYVARVG